MAAPRRRSVERADQFVPALSVSVARLQNYFAKITELLSHVRIHVVPRIFAKGRSETMVQIAPARYDQRVRGLSRGSGCDTRTEHRCRYQWRSCPRIAAALTSCLNAERLCIVSTVTC